MAYESNQLVFRLVVVLFLCIGFFNAFVNWKENPCKMTYMYEPPQYLEVCT